MRQVRAHSAGFFFFSSAFSRQGRISLRDAERRDGSGSTRRKRLAVEGGDGASIRSSDRRASRRNDLAQPLFQGSDDRRVHIDPRPFGPLSESRGLAARSMLVDAAARTRECIRKECATKDGTDPALIDGKRFGLWRCRGIGSNLPIPEHPTLKSTGRFQDIGMTNIASIRRPKKGERKRRIRGSTGGWTE